MDDVANAKAVLTTLRECYPNDEVLAEQLDADISAKTLRKAANGSGHYQHNPMGIDTRTAVFDHYRKLQHLHVAGEEALVMAVQTVERLRACETIEEVTEAADRLERALNSKLADL